MIKKIQWRFWNLFLISTTFILAPYFYFRILLNKQKKQLQLRILILQRAKIGDLVCTTQIFRETKKKYPSSFLALLASNYASPIVANNPYIDEIITFDEKIGDFKTLLNTVKKIKKRNFTWSASVNSTVMDTVMPFWSGIPQRISSISRHSFLSSKILSIFNNHNLNFKDNDLAYSHYLRLLKFIGIDESNFQTDIFIDDSADKKAAEFLNKHNFSEEDFSVAICPTAGNEFKEWEPEKWIILTNRLIEKFNAKIVFIGSKNDTEKISKIRRRINGETVDSSSHFSLEELPALLKKIRLCLTVFNGPMHIADALNKPMVAIAGPCSIYHQRPIGDNSIVIHKSLYCQPCLSCTETKRDFRDCREGHRLCIKDTKVDEVYDAVLSLIDKIK